jgi:DNA-binding transcriptional LysR family regulator
MRSLNLDQLRALCSVVDLGTISAAARQLNLTQPAVSQQIRELEARVGVPLLERLGRRIQPTAAGNELAERARRIEFDVDAALHAMRRYQEGYLGRVRIGAAAVVTAYLLPHAIARLRRDNPGLDLSIWVGPSADIIDRVTSNQLDLGLVSVPVVDRAVALVPWRELPQVAIFPANMADPPAAVRAQDLAERDLILWGSETQLAAEARGWFESAGLELRPMMELSDHLARRRLVAAGVGVSLVPAISVASPEDRRGIVVRPLDPPLARRLALAMRPDKPDSPALSCAIEAILEIPPDPPIAP